MNNGWYAGYTPAWWGKGLSLASALGLLWLSGCRNERGGTSEPPALREGATPDGGAKTRAAPAGRQTGTVEGRVSMKGEVPPQAPLKTSPSVARQCGPEVPDRSLVIGQGGALAFAVVWLAEAVGQPSAPPAGAPKPASIDQWNCLYEPPVLAARAGGTLEIHNADPLLHNVRAREGGTPLFNVAMPLSGMKLSRRLPEAPGEVFLRCDVHPWMRAVVKTFDHPYFATTDAQGHYRLEGLPAGRHELVFWHERLPERRVPVEVPVDGLARQDLEWPVGELQGRH